MQEHFTSDAGKRYADNVCRRSLTVRCIRQKSVDRHLIQFSYALDKSSLAGAESGMIFIKMTIEHFRCFCKSRNTGHILGTGAEVLLLSATEYDGLDLHPFPYIQQSDALRSVDLVSTDGQQINVHLLGIDPGFSESLYRIHMEQRIRVHLFDQSSGFLNGLQGSDLVIRVHDRYQNGLRCHGSA